MRQFCSLAKTRTVRRQSARGVCVYVSANNDESGLVVRQSLVVEGTLTQFRKNTRNSTASNGHHLADVTIHISRPSSAPS